MKIDGPTNILASKTSLESLGTNLISLSIPRKSKKTRVEPRGIAIRTNTFRVTCSVSSLNKIACERNHASGKITRAKVEIPNVNNFFS